MKGTNHFQAEYVLNYAASLIRRYCEGESFSDIVTYQAEEYAEKKITSSVERINGRLGTSFIPKQIKETLERLHFKVFMGDKSFVAAVPSWRLDVTCDADLSEEVIRLLGFDNVKSELPCLDTKVGALTLEQGRLKNIRYLLLDKGLDECLTYSLISKKEEKLFNLLNSDEHYSILNPLTDEREVFRTHILHSLLKVATYNVARQNKNLALFETSHMISKSSKSTNLAIVLVGKEARQKEMEGIPYDFYHMKGLVEAIMDMLGVEASRYRFDRNKEHLDELHPGKSATIVFQNQVIGRFGELHPNKIAEYDLGKSSAVVLEMNLDSLLSAKVSITKMTPISRFPSVSRDLAFVVDKTIEAKDLIRSIKFTGKALVSEAQVFDVYEGEHVGEGKKSVAISVTYSCDDHTLTDKEIIEVENRIKFELTKQFKAELRG